MLLKKSSGNQCNHILFPCPGPYGKGILVQKTLWGNLILGPTARDQHEWPNPNRDPDSKEDVLAKILPACRRLVPSFDVADAFHSFSGARAKSTRGDWCAITCVSHLHRLTYRYAYRCRIIEPSKSEPNFIHAAGIDSPGIAGSPAIALELVELLKSAGLSAAADPEFNPAR